MKTKSFSYTSLCMYNYIYCLKILCNKFRTLQCYFNVIISISIEYMYKERNLKFKTLV